MNGSAANESCHNIRLTVIVVDQCDNGGGNEPSENVQKGKTQHRRVKNVPGGEDTILQILNLITCNTVTRNYQHQEGK